MNKRLQTILEIEQITPSQLADTLGVQRGGISHLLSGRNKPSFDFLEKILRKYPNISAEWLITGQGKPLRSDYESTTAPFSSKNSFNPIQQTNFQSDIFGDNNFENTDLQTLTEEKNKSKAADSSTPSPDRQTLSPSPSKKPVRIIVYFSDGTYTEFYPFSVNSRPE